MARRCGGFSSLTCHPIATNAALQPCSSRSARTTSPDGIDASRHAAPARIRAQSRRGPELRARICCRQGRRTRTGLRTTRPRGPRVGRARPSRWRKGTSATMKRWAKFIQIAVGHRGHRAENAPSSGALSSRTMMVTMTAKTASEYAASRCAVSRSSRIKVLGDLRREDVRRATATLRVDHKSDSTLPHRRPM